MRCYIIVLFTLISSMISPSACFSMLPEAHRGHQGVPTSGVRTLLDALSTPTVATGNACHMRRYLRLLCRATAPWLAALYLQCSPRGLCERVAGIISMLTAGPQCAQRHGLGTCPRKSQDARCGAYLCLMKRPAIRPARLSSSVCPLPATPAAAPLPARPTSLSSISARGLDAEPRPARCGASLCLSLDSQYTCPRRFN